MTSRYRGGIDRAQVAALLRISAAQIETRQINDVTLNIRDTDRQYVADGPYGAQRRNRPGGRSRTVTITMQVPGDHGDDWYRASVGEPLLAAPPAQQIEHKREPVIVDVGPDGSWKCGKCGQLNSAGATTCGRCEDT